MKMGLFGASTDFSLFSSLLHRYEDYCDPSNFAADLNFFDIDQLLNNQAPLDFQDMQDHPMP